MPNLYGITDDQIEALRSAEKALADARKSINDTFLGHYQIKSGDIVEDTSNGLQYKVDWCSIDLRTKTNKLSISMAGYRVWKSGSKIGRTAHSISFLRASDVKKVEVDEKL